ncbi:potassium channel family protein [Marinicella sp. W31]|uniref:potassium channel family protein n=1 Tax=Marinicella sp. W31 TaxID=3023713 RepID=UPI0037584509
MKDFFMKRSFAKDNATFLILGLIGIGLVSINEKSLGWTIFSTIFLVSIPYLWLVIRFHEYVTLGSEKRFFKEEKNQSEYKTFVLIILLFILSTTILIWFFSWLYNINNTLMIGKDFVPNFFDNFYFSTITMTSVGYGDYRPVGDIGKFLAITQSLLGYVNAIIFLSYALGNINIISKRKVIKQ